MSDPIESLAARIAAGEAIDPDGLPEALRQRPEVERLLRLGRVMQGLDANHAEAEAAGRAPPAAEQDRSGERLGPFRLLSRLGSGGMGEVWLAERDDGELRQRVALKRVRADLPGFAGRLRSERRILARLEHPGIARFIDAGVDADGSPWLALEYVEGLDLGEWCRQARPSLEQRLALFRKVCAAVDHAHRQLVVHRDIKPGNVLVDATGEPRLLDFGIARLVDDSQAEATSSGMTPAYAAPEQLRGEAVTTATDIYALGLLLFRLVAGTLPPSRREASAATVLARLDREDAQRPSDHLQPGLPWHAAALRGDLDAIVAQALRADPLQRYRSARELGDDVARHLASRPVLARPLTRRYRLGRFLRRNPAAAGFAALAVLAVLVGSAISLQQARRAGEAAALARLEAESARRAQARAEQANRFLESLFREQDPFARGTPAPRSPAELLAEGVERVQLELGDDPDARMRLLAVLGEAQFGQGDSEAARRTLGDALSLADTVGDRASRARIGGALARVAEAGLRLDEALATFDAAVADATVAHGESSREVATLRRERARVRLHATDLAGALADAEAAIQVLANALGETHPDTALAHYHRGLVREQMREDQAALADFLAVAIALEAAWGAGDVRLVRPLMSLGDAQRRLRDFDAGRATLERAEAIAAAGLGERHAQRSAVLIRLGTLERDAGRLDAAIAALDRAQAALPDGEAATLAQLLATRGTLHLARGDVATAERDLREAMRLRKALGGPRNGLAWYSQAEWGVALAALGRLAEAERAQREARLALLDIMGPEAYQNSLVAARLGATLARLGRDAEAAAEYAEAERLVVAQLGDGNHNALQYRMQRALLLARLPGERESALALLADLESRVATDAALADALPQLGELRTRLASR